MGKIHERFKTGQTKRHVPPPSAPPLVPQDKGKLFGKCNITRCLNRPATWSNKGMGGAYYCRSCALDINKFPVEGVGPLCHDAWGELLRRASGMSDYNQALALLLTALPTDKAMRAANHAMAQPLPHWEGLDRSERTRDLNDLIEEALLP